MAGIQIIRHLSDIIVWLKLGKEYFGLRNDLYIANSYFVPEGSSHLHVDAFCLTHGRCMCLATNCDVLMCGYYNSSTSTDPDYMISLNYGSDGDFNELMPSEVKTWPILTSEMQRRGKLCRYSQGHGHSNKHGTKLLDLCRATGLLILNGRVGKDKGIGEYTRVDTTGWSVVDYMISNPELIAQIEDFKIMPRLPESDHRGLSVTLKYRVTGLKKIQKPTTAWAWCPKYKWSHSDLVNIEGVLRDHESQLQRKKFGNAVADLWHQYSCTPVQ